MGRTQHISEPDLYAEARRVADRLAAAGRDDRANAIRDAIDGGFTGTEILMRLRFQLRLLADGRDREKTLAATLVQKIDGIIGP